MTKSIATKGKARLQAGLSNHLVFGDIAMITGKSVAALMQCNRVEYFSDLQDSIAVAQSRTPGQQQHAKQRQAHQDRLAAGLLDFALICKLQVVA